MAFELKLPDLGDGLTEAEIVSWLVEQGDTVAANQPLVEVETDKAVVEIPSVKAGVVLQLGAAAGSTLVAMHHPPLSICTHSDCQIGDVESLLELLDPIRAEVPSLRHVVVIGEHGRADDIFYSEWIAAASPELDAARTHREDICCLNYTSGTTGEP